MSLTPLQLARLSELIDQGIDLSEEARRAWLSALDESDAEVRRALAGAFAEDGRALDFKLTLPAVPAAASSNEPITHVAGSGERFGAWRIDRLLGTGGMGQVWLALRDDGRYDGRAAVKLVRSFANDAMRRRFEVEGKLLARLEHPNIARLLDAGERSDGSGAYLILEYVDGAPIDRWADERKLSVAARLKLFMQICAALSYAHANLVVHRDIKPSNILVQDNGQLKLLDFGVAKLIEDGSGNDLTIETGTAHTPNYASPEQIDGRPISVTSDVYSLGVLLFRLLAGTSPYETKQTGRLELERAILSEQPRRLSTASRTRLLTSSPRTNTAEPLTEKTSDPAPELTPEAIAELRGTTPDRLRRALSGDLEVILATALKKHPNERYATVQAFADDIERYLNHQPILARADSWAYRATKFVRRNWLPVTAASAVGLATVGGVTATLWQADQAKLEAQRANAIRDFLIGVFSSSDVRIAYEKPRGQMTARELLDVSAAKIEKDFADFPETQHDLLGYFAEIYRELSEDKRYDQLRERQRLVIEKYYSPLSDQAIEWTLAGANRICYMAKPTGCEEILRAADEQIKRANKDDSKLRADWFRYKAASLQTRRGAAAERKATLANAIALLEKHEPQSRRLVTAIADLGIAYNDELDYLKAIELYKQALLLGQSLSPQNVNETAQIYANLGLAYFALSRFDEAADTLRAGVALMAQSGGNANPTSWQLRQTLALVYGSNGKREEALKIFAELMPDLPPATLPLPEANRARNAYADALINEGRHTEAIEILEQIERHYMVNVASEAPLRWVRLLLGSAYQGAGRFADAKRVLKAALDEVSARYEPNYQRVLALREAYGNLLFEMRDLDGAAEQFKEIVARANERKLAHIALAHGGLARIAAARGKVDVALAESEKALDMWANKTGFSNVRMGPRLQRMRADALAAAGRFEEAQKFEDEAWRTSQKFDGPANPTTQRRVMRSLRVSNK
ncbi:MAG: protein kinase domain-containing protein [Casimicrobium sp.]